MDKKRYRILHTVPSISRISGGPAYSVTQLSAGLLREALDVDLLTSVDGNEDIVDYDPNIHLITVRGQNMTMWGRLTAGSFQKPLNAAKVPYRIIHQSGLWLKCHHETAVYAHRQQIPVVLSPRGMIEQWSLNYHRGWKQIAWRLFQKKDMQRAVAFHATSENEAENLRKLGLQQAISIIPNGINLPAEIMRNPKADGEARTALFLSRVNPKKGIRMLLDAWKRLSPPGWRLVIAGNDDSNHQPEMESHCRALGLSDVVEFFGPAYREQKDELLRESDLFILPSFSENFGIVVAEALAHSLPVLTTTGCPWAELPAQDCGWWVAPEQAPIEKALGEALASPSSRLIAMGVNGRRLVEARYQWPSIAKNMRATYDWLLGQGDKPSCIFNR